ncbi:uncharacterized protein RAG0_07840 [Rhynchosporium agropyri]|uniref:Uncharacterized protein n=1 Tax=Rhynchosporium agropyri TaxID=914238 RepID=A0A1E1KRC6_9HELO|nr:uncharacterized protein RAG0_07840 [Rhynchosporium agropyri]
MGIPVDNRIYAYYLNPVTYFRAGCSSSKAIASILLLVLRGRILLAHCDHATKDKPEPANNDAGDSMRSRYGVVR